ncbi:MAG: helix-hairpin-helix domain-containing protein [Marinobacter sp.]|nr:helix-hairpin-helix domain-containing protein [Marinobacter sp.]
MAAYESKPVAEQGQALTQPKININTADAETLASQLKGIGQSRAEAIVAYREAHGPFTSVDDLTAVRGIGQRTLEQNEGLLSVE